MDSLTEEVFHAAEDHGGVVDGVDIEPVRATEYCRAMPPDRS